MNIVYLAPAFADDLKIETGFVFPLAEEIMTLCTLTQIHLSFIHMEGSASEHLVTQYHIFADTEDLHTPQTMVTFYINGLGLSRTFDLI